MPLGEIGESESALYSGVLSNLGVSIPPPGRVVGLALLLKNTSGPSMIEILLRRRELPVSGRASK
jgi:hypothetical protein